MSEHTKGRPTPLTDDFVHKLINRMEAAGAIDLDEVRRELIHYGRQLERDREELIEALRLLLYGQIEGEQAMTPAGDRLEAIYEPGTLRRIREVLDRLSPSTTQTDKE